MPFAHEFLVTLDENCEPASKKFRKGPIIMCEFTYTRPFYAHYEGTF